MNVRASAGERDVPINQVHSPKVRSVSLGGREGDAKADKEGRLQGNSAAASPLSPFLKILREVIQLTFDLK